MLTAAVDPASLLPVAIETIRRGESFDFELYLRDAVGASVVLYSDKNIPVQASDLKSLEQQGIRTLYITQEAVRDYERYLRERVLTDPSTPSDGRFCALREANRSVFLSALNNGNLNKVVQVAQELADELADLVCDQDQTLDYLFKLLRHDYYTYTHVTNVCVYALALAQGLGMRAKHDLAAVATGALLHDIGKRHIPAAILNKEGKLSEPEMVVVRRHPGDGFRELCRRDDLTWAQLMMVYQHHERLDGHGYPVGVTGADIHPWGRICAITDVYDAISSYRPYRGPMLPQHIRALMLSESGRHFDPEMIRCWMKLIK